MHVDHNTKDKLPFIKMIAGNLTARLSATNDTVCATAASLVKCLENNYLQI